MTEIGQEDLNNLLKHFSENDYFQSKSSDENSLNRAFMDKAEALFKLDYNLVTVNPTEGPICARYPEKILIPVSERSHEESNTTSEPTTVETLAATTAATTLQVPNEEEVPNEEVPNEEPAEKPETSSASAPLFDFLGPLEPFLDSNFVMPELKPFPPLSPLRSPDFGGAAQRQRDGCLDLEKVRELLVQARYARCRCRFVLPVILFRGKFICRSATVSKKPEQVLRIYIDSVNRLNNAATTSTSTTNGNGSANGQANGNGNDSAEADAQQSRDSELYDPVEDERIAELQKNTNSRQPDDFSSEAIIMSDVALLKEFNVTTIVDLMVEKYKTKYLIPVTSSEKGDEAERYKDFAIMSVPYPGCEFFKAFRDDNYVADNIYFDWTQSFVDAPLTLPPGCPAAELDINWPDYQKWDLKTMTQNYVKAILKCLKDGSGGLLLHCISGWDRTPLFVSLIRLSLWADGLIHQSLTPIQMAYFTLVYDWYLFGHLLKQRASYGEEILYFCFKVLKDLASEDFSIVDPPTAPTQRRRTKTSSSSSSGPAVLPSGSEEEQRDDFDVNSNEDSSCDNPFGDGFYSWPMKPRTPPPTRQTLQSQSISPLSTGSSNSRSPQKGRSPNLKRTHTSPIAVPGTNAAAMSRQRHDSNSSGGWNFVNEMGSMDSTKNVTMSETNSNGTGGGVAPPPEPLRSQRIREVRQVVLRTYAQKVGLKLKQGSTSMFSKLF